MLFVALGSLTGTKLPAEAYVEVYCGPADDVFFTKDGRFADSDFAASYKIFFFSHIWQTKEHPCPDGAPFRRHDFRSELDDLAVRATGRRFDGQPDDFDTSRVLIFYDYVSLMQKDAADRRTPEEWRVFKAQLRSLGSVSRNCTHWAIAHWTEAIDGYGYFVRGWCLFEMAMMLLYFGTRTTEEELAASGLEGCVLEVKRMALQMEDPRSEPYVSTLHYERLVGWLRQQLAEAHMTSPSTDRVVVQGLFEKAYRQANAEGMVAATFRLVDGGGGDAKGHWRKRVEQLSRRVELEGRVHGYTSREVAKTLMNLGVVEGFLGNQAEKKAHLVRALAIFEAHHGAEHPAVARTLTNLGNAEGALGHCAEGKAHLVRALAIDEAHYGAEHPEVAITLGNLGVAEGFLGNHVEKKAHLVRALAIKEAHYGQV